MFANYDTNKCYKFYDWKKTWDEAKDMCENRLNGVLASVPDRKTNDFLTNIVMKVRGNCGERDDRKCEAWLGANDKSSEGRWRWIDGSGSVGYTNWMDSEPNNLLGGEDCLVTNWDGYGVRYSRWNDAPCSNKKFKYGFICQSEPCRSWRDC